MQVEKSTVESVIAQMIADGHEPFNGSARSTSKGGEQAQLPAGTYTAVLNSGIQVADTSTSRSGRHFDVLHFTTKDGKDITVGTGSIFNAARVVKGVNPKDVKPGQKWLGEVAQPTEYVFRYGDALANCERDTVYVDGTPRSVYKPVDFTLTTQKVYVVPRFVDGSTTPVFNEQCDLRVAWFA